MGVFKLVNGNLVLSRIEITAIPEYSEILKRDKGSEGDHDGRKKYRAFAEFLYVFFMYDYESPYITKGEDDRKATAIKLAKLPENFKPDRDLRKAINVYIKDQDDAAPSRKILVSLERGLTIANKIVDALITKMERSLKVFEQAMNAPVPEGMVVNIPDISPMITDLNTLITMAGKIPDTIESIAKIRDKVNQEKGSGELLRGDKEKRNRENPKYLDEKFKDSLNITDADESSNQDS